jgi:uncharacterized membrane protein YhaH (DUF805 family)
MAGRIFINYRRGDSQGAAGRLYDHLLQHFERAELFMDVDAIEPGVDFVKSLDEHVSNCSAFIAVIGPGWAAAREPDGTRRLDNPNDFVRVELESALKRDIRVIPVLVDGASMPRASDLPDALQPLLRRNAVEFAHHRFAADCDDLARNIKRALGIATEAPAAPEGPAVTQVPPQAQPPARQLSWAEVFLAFRGRVPRGRFLIAILILVAVFLAVLFAINAVVTEVFAGEAEKLALFEKRLTSILAVLLIWPSWALLLKRLHDLGYGWLALIPFAGLDTTTQILDYYDQDALSSQLTFVFLGACFMLGAAKGNDGPNKYGPDPLAKAAPPAAATL